MNRQNPLPYNCNKSYNHRLSNQSEYSYDLLICQSLYLLSSEVNVDRGEERVGSEKEEERVCIISRHLLDDDGREDGDDGAAEPVEEGRVRD